MQKMILFLQEPMESDSIFIRGLTADDLLASQIAPAAELGGIKQLNLRNPYSVIWNRSGNSLPEILVRLPAEADAVRLEAYDLYGKCIATLFAGPLPAGRTSLPRGDEWGQLENFHGICYFQLAVGGQVVHKEIYAKVQ